MLQELVIIHELVSGLVLAETRPAQWVTLRNI